MFAQLMFSVAFSENGLEINNAPALADYNGVLYMAWNAWGTVNQIGYSFLKTGATPDSDDGWQEPLQPGLSYALTGSPALVSYRGSLYLFYRGYGKQSSFLYYGTYDGKSWSLPQNAGPFSCSGSPAVAISGGWLFIAWQGLTSNTLYYASFDGTSWSSAWLSPYKPQSAPALAAIGYLLYMAWNENGTIQYSVMNTEAGHPVWPSTSIDTGFNITGAPAMCYFDGTLYLCWLGTGEAKNTLFYAAWTGTSWTTAMPVSAAIAVDGPAITGIKDSLALAWRAPDHGGRDLWTSLTYRQNMANWMERTYSTLQNRTLKQIALPGAHDAAMYVCQGCTTHANACNTQTQTLTMAQMLNAGVRYFDLRPMQSKGTLYCGHMAEVPALGSLGCLGDTLQNVLQAVADFFKGGAQELVILTFSHYLDLDTGKKDDPHMLQHVVAMVESTLRSYLYKNTTSQRLGSMPLSNFIGAQGSVMACFKDPVKPIHQLGIYTYADYPSKTDPDADLLIYDRFSDMNDAAKMAKDQLQKLEDPGNHGGDMFLLSWTLTLSKSQAASNSTCIKPLALTANNQLMPQLYTAIKNKQVTPQLMPNVIYTDFVDGWGAQICMELNEALAQA